MTTLEQLEGARKAVERAHQALEEEAEYRDALIRQARDEGVSLRRIAKAAGISYQRVFQIAGTT